MAHLSERKRDRKAYRLAKKYLLAMKPTQLSEADVEKYLVPRGRKVSLEDIYKQILQSASNTQMAPRVIKKGIPEWDKLGPVLCNFDPHAVGRKYLSWEGVFAEIIRKLKPAGKVRRERNSIFPRLCRTILDGAAFLSRFPNAGGFYRWAELFNVEDDDVRLALPTVLHRSISGLGFALSCDFLKEMGFEHYGKPDTWIIKEFKALKLSQEDSTPKQVLLDLFRVAKHAGVTAYAVDKVFWLIGSQKFHLHKNSKGKGSAEDFISYARKELRHSG